MPGTPTRPEEAPPAQAAPAEPWPEEAAESGAPAPLGLRAGYLGVVGSTVRELLSVGEGRARVGLLVARDRRGGGLCVGYRQEPAGGHVAADFRCFGPGAAEPVIAYVGRSGAELGEVGRLAIVGVALARVASVSALHAGGRREALDLRPVAGGVSAFALPYAPPPFPRALVAAGADGAPLVELDLRPAHEARCDEPGLCDAAGVAWADVVDPSAG